MGNTSSSPTDSKHVFSPATPINFSPTLIDSFQSSPETSSSRAKTLDLHIQQRVAEELERIQNRENDKLGAARQKIHDEAESQGKSSSDKSKSSDGDSTAKGSGNNILDLNISAKDLLPDALTPFSKQSPEEARKKQTSSKVQSQLDQLKQQLSARKVLKDLPKDVEKARQDVISCLRVNDRRPLDCWKEVEVFKASVRELEEEFVRKVL